MVPFFKFFWLSWHGMTLHYQLYILWKKYPKVVIGIFLAKTWKMKFNGWISLSTMKRHYKSNFLGQAFDSSCKIFLNAKNVVFAKISIFFGGQKANFYLLEKNCWILFNYIILHKKWYPQDLKYDPCTQYLYSFAFLEIIFVNTEIGWSLYIFV